MHPDKLTTAEKVALATAVHRACLETLLTAYEDARIDGLCREGAWECAVDALRALNVAALAEIPFSDS